MGARLAATGPGQSPDLRVLHVTDTQRPAYPPAERLPLVDDLHGHHVPDPYRWLEDATDPRTQAWSDAEDDLFAEQAAGWPGRDSLAARIRELLSAGVVGVPVWRGERRFFVRREGTQEHGVLLTVDGDGTERVLVDPIALDPTGLTTLDAWQPSKEGHLLAYQLSEGGTEESVLRVLDVATGVQVEGPIDRARYSPVAWLPGAEGYYYVRRLDPAGLPEAEQQYHRRVWFHRLGTDPADDAEIFGAGLDIRSYYGASVSLDGRWLIVSAATGTAPRNDVWIASLDGTDPAAPALTEIAVGLDAHVGATRRARRPPLCRDRPRRSAWPPRRHDADRPRPADLARPAPPGRRSRPRGLRRPRRAGARRPAAAHRLVDAPRRLRDHRARPGDR